MIKHIVMWSLKEEALGKSKAANGKEICEKLGALPGKIKEIIDFEVGENFNPAPAAYDLCLYSTFESKEALQAYQIHPDHVDVRNFILSVVESSVVVDYEI